MCSIHDCNLPNKKWTDLVRQIEMLWICNGQTWDAEVVGLLRAQMAYVIPQIWSLVIFFSHHRLVPFLSILHS